MHGSVFRDRYAACSRHTKRQAELGRGDRGTPGTHRAAERADQCPGGGRSRTSDQGRARRGPGTDEERRQARAIAWRADHHQGSLRCRGPAHDIQPPAAQGQHCQERRQPGREIARGGCDHPRQDQCARAVRRLSDRQSAVRYDQEPLGCATVGGRLDRRRSCRRGGTLLAAGVGQRYRRFGTQSRALQRHLLAEAYGMARARPWARARPAGRHPGGTLHGRVRSSGALGRGSRDGACASSPDPTATRRRRHPCRSVRRLA